jgi:hypothetical protein
VTDAADARLARTVLRSGALSARRESAVPLVGAAGEGRRAQSDEEQPEKPGTPTTELMIHSLSSNLRKSRKSPNVAGSRKAAGSYQVTARAETWADYGNFSAGGLVGATATLSQYVRSWPARTTARCRFTTRSRCRPGAISASSRTSRRRAFTRCSRASSTSGRAPLTTSRRCTPTSLRERGSTTRAPTRSRSGSRFVTPSEATRAPSSASVV